MSTTSQSAPLSRSLVLLDQTWAMTQANLKSRYRKSASGFLWVILNPLIMFGVQSHVFRKILNIQVTDYSIFLLSGLLPWIFISQTLEMSTSSLVFSGRLLKSFPIHPLVCLLAQGVDNLVNFLAAFLVIFGFLAFSQPEILIRLPFLIAPLLLLFIAIFSLAWILATLQVFFRDTRFLLSFALNASFFLTPVFYPASFIPEGYRWMIAINPFNHLIAPFRAAVHPASGASLGTTCLAAAVTALVFFTGAVLLWRSRRNAVYFHL